MRRGADRLTLLAAVAARLRERAMPFAVIGAAALAVHGVTRSTRDLDVLTLAREALDERLWQPLQARSIQARIRPGDAADPLAGVVRFTRDDEVVDLIVGKNAWQGEIVAQAEDAIIEGERVPVARPAGLVLLKLFAGGPQDLWDIAQLLEGPDRPAIVAAVEAALDQLPSDCRDLWRRVRSGR